MKKINFGAKVIRKIVKSDKNYNELKKMIKNEESSHVI